MAFTNPVQAAGFDCAKAATTIEKMICADAELSQLDERYSAIYSKVRAVAKRKGKASEKRIKSEAVKALETRNSSCRDHSCLTRWYEAGLFRLDLQWQSLRSHRVRKPSSAEIYESLNLRTFGNMHGPLLKASCESYLKDIFDKSVVNARDDKLVIDDGEYYWQVLVLDDETIEVQNVIHGTGYLTTREYKIFYNTIDHDFRVVNKNYNDQPERCVHGNFKQLASTGFVSTLSYDVKSADSISVGEFYLSGDLGQFGIGVFESPNGRRVGNLYGNIKYDNHGLTSTLIRIQDAEFRTLVKPPLISRHQEHAALLVFGVSQGWYNISYDPDMPLWISRHSLPDLLSQGFNTREKVMLDSNSIKVKSAHRLRATPTTGSAKLAVLNRLDNTTVQPLEIKGDWMRVRQISPALVHQTFEDIVGSASHTVIEGWLKWRESHAVQYVDVAQYW